MEETPQAVFLLILPLPMNKIQITAICLLLVFASCTSDRIPQDAQYTNVVPAIYPDWHGITIPINIAPLNFIIQEEGDEWVVTARSKNDMQIVVSADGNTVCWEEETWHELLDSCKADTLYMDVYASVEGKWLKYTPIKCYVSPDVIDSYLSYRLIEPSFVLYENLSINQRNLTNFEERVIFNNGRPVEDFRGKCINCHSFQDYNRTDRMQFHVREYRGGTMIAENGNVKKVNLKTGDVLSAGVYPAWHPTQNLIAYSTNLTRQHFHSKNTQKVEVIDLASDLVLYDVDQNVVTTICNDSNAMETFPSWSPDGKYLYYVSAAYPEGIARDKETLFEHYQNIHYDIYRRSFNISERTFSEPDTIFKASAMHRSATFPRISPDGRYLLFTMGDYGTFHIWHKSSDLYIMDLQTSDIRPLALVNSLEAESYHSWSSNGSWIVFSSRRDDGSYTRPYFSYFKDGKASKPFILPQKDPHYYTLLMKSFNVPEFMVKPVNVSRKRWVDAAEGPAVPAVYHRDATIIR